MGRAPGFFPGRVPFCVNGWRPVRLTGQRMRGDDGARVCNGGMALGDRRAHNGVQEGARRRTPSGQWHFGGGRSRGSGARGCRAAVRNRCELGAYARGAQRTVRTAAVVLVRFVGVSTGAPQVTSINGVRRHDSLTVQGTGERGPEQILRRDNDARRGAPMRGTNVSRCTKAPPDQPCLPCLVRVTRTRVNFQTPAQLVLTSLVGRVVLPPALSAER
jgi:hypothetical protein